MRDDELTLLRAVAEAARAVLVRWDKMGSVRVLEARLAALDAHTPAPEGEMVEVRAAVIFYSQTDWMVRGNAGWEQSDMEEEAQGRGRPLSAIITARVRHPSPIPTIAATVTPVDRSHD